MPSRMGFKACRGCHKRLDLARVLSKLGRADEALQRLHELSDSLGRKPDPGDGDRQLLEDAGQLQKQIVESL